MNKQDRGVVVVISSIIAVLMLAFVIGARSCGKDDGITIPSPDAYTPLPSVQPTIPAPVAEPAKEPAIVVAPTVAKHPAKVAAKCNAECAAYAKAYANAARANALLGEPRFRTGPSQATFRGVHEVVAAHTLIRNDTGIGSTVLVNHPWVVGVFYR